MRVTVIIPTKDRPGDLSKAIASVVAQSEPPDEVLIIDQSGQPPPCSDVARFGERFGSAADFRWLHDPSISGLVHAKEVGSALARGEIVCFLEDDVVLEAGYLQAIRHGFARNPSIVGASGVVTNPPFGRAYALVHALFHRGMFHDPRPMVYASLVAGQTAPIRSHALSGGLSAWRSHVLAEVRFDRVNGFHMLEDLDYSTRVRARFGDRLVILPGARLAHYFSPIGRASIGPRERRKVIEFITFFRSRPRRARDGAWLAWLLVGVAAAAVATAVRHGSWLPVSGFLGGFADGWRKRIQSVSGTAETDGAQLH